METSEHDKAVWERRVPIEWEARKPITHSPDEPVEVAGEILEIGPGRGEMLLWLAQQHPEKRFVAIEMTLGRYRRIIRRAERMGLTNIRLMRGNARVAVPRYFRSATFERIYVLFPDPWPKLRHAQHRLLHVEFLNLLSSLMKDQGELILATDHTPYAAWVAANLTHVPTLVNLGTPFSYDTTLIPNPDRTHFEKKWRQEGKEIVFVHAQKRGQSERPAASDDSSSL